ncbi:hypothetical protein HUU42_02350 [bacterium]|nr:hypothetical protein [bacterium]
MRNLIWLNVLLISTLHAQVYITKDEALKLYFPDQQQLSRKTIFLDDAQVQQIQTAARAKVESKVVTYYEYRENGTLQNIAFFETQTVRTQPATYMVVIDANGSVKAVEMLAFYEPEDYLPPKKWLNQFKTKNLSHDLYTKRGIPNVAGATLSAQAITESIRRLLTIFQLYIQPSSAK